MINTDQLQTLLQYLAGFSAVTFLISIICIPLLISRLPSDFFLRYAPGRLPVQRKITAGYILVFLLKNSLGFALLCAGIAMLFLPGQGLITIILSLSLISFPYKNQFIYALTSRSSVQTSLDWIREKTKKPSFYW